MGSWRGCAALFAAAVVASCNTTGSLEIPQVEQPTLIEVDARPEQQASFVLSKVVSGIRRGTTIMHFPMGGVDGVRGYLCNMHLGGEATLEWGQGTAFLGDWSTELGDVFYETLAARGLNVAGNPADLFRRADSVDAAEYLVGARIVDIRGNMCQPQHWWHGRPLNEYGGEMLVEVEWTIFSSLRQREVLTTRTSGYFKLADPKRDGIAVTFHEAFAAAAENLLASRDFVDLATGRATSTVAAGDSPIRHFAARPLSTQPLDRMIDRVLPAVVTIRLGAGHGSGFVFSEDGFILTNQHVVGTGRQVGIVLNNGVEIAGDVLARDERRDVALIKIPLRVPSYLPLRTAMPAPPEGVFAIGTPLDTRLSSTVTTGVVSAIRTDPRSGLVFIQSDAAVSPGNSGGPLLDERGNVVGISAAKVVGAEGVNLFIPIGAALEALNLRATQPVS